jgi:propionyl-CoA carboxylase alpha chain
VEHPVTECITGLDLVEQMIRVAAGEKLAFAQADIPRKGWAMECRINAEDPFRGFLPSTGRLVRYQPSVQTMEAALPMPEQGGVRVDTGVYEGGEIPMYYDSMIAKLIVHGRDRDEAIAKMREALNAFVIRGIASNITFHSALLAQPAFAAGDFDTGFIARHFGKGFVSAELPHDDPLFLVALAAFVRRKARERAGGISGQLDGHRVKNLPDLVVVVLGRHGEHRHHPVRIDQFEPVSGKADVTIEGRHFAIQSPSKLGEALMVGTCNGRAFTAQIERAGPAGGARNPLAIRVMHNGSTIETLVLLPRAAQMLELMPHKAPPDLSKFLLSPMPGLLVELAVAPGQKVQAGERLAVIEAMKMENILTATQEGTVGALLASTGESLTVDQPILSFA